MWYFIKQNSICIINQSFKDFEIIIVNYASRDGIGIIIKHILSNNKRIKIISNNQALGVYKSKIECIINSKDKFKWK